jgi:phage shock protein PspC (stress-responsive transcriptional regulator)
MLEHVTESRMTTPTGTPDMPAGGPGQYKRWHRSRRDRMLAGVCGGVGESLGVDPVVIRVVVVVLTFFGGAGVVAYIAGWLLLADGEEASPVRRALGRRGGEAWTGLALIGLLALAVVITLDSLVSGWGPGHQRGPFPLVILFGLVAAGYLLLKRQDAQAAPAAGPLPTGAPDTPAWSAAPGASPSSTAPVDLGKSDPTAAPGGPPPGAPWVPPVPSTPPPDPAPEPRSMVGLATFSLILIALGGLAVAQTLGLDVAPPVYPAVVLAGSGLGLLVVTRYGRARGLIALGIIALLAIGPTAVVNEYDGKWVSDDTPIRPLAVADVASEYRYRVGQIDLDLSAVDFTAQSVATHIRLGAGETLVYVPRTVDVVIAAKVRVGELNVFDRTEEGIDNRITLRDDGPDGPGGGTLNLTINQGVGHVEVVRVDIPSPTTPKVPAPAEPAQPAAPQESAAPTSPEQPEQSEQSEQNQPGAPAATSAPEVSGAAA